MKVKVFNKVTLTEKTSSEGNIRLAFKKTVELYILFNNQDVFEFVDNPAEADIIPVQVNQHSGQGSGQPISDKWFRECAMHFNKNQIAVNLNHLMHIDENVMGRHDIDNENKSAMDPRSPFKKIVNLHSDISLRDEDHDYESFIYTDFLFNRSHTMHFDNELVKAHWDSATEKNHWWRHPSDGETSGFPSTMFELTPDHKIIRRLTKFKNFCNRNREITQKIFVAPNLSRRATAGNDGTILRSTLRTKLGKLLYDYQGYIGDISQGTALVPHRDSYDDFDILGINGWGFSPPHNDYYDSSSISIYIETLTYNEVHASRCITEKTFTPMCKGHFVLPFGTPGTIDHLKSEYGFEFPHWLDYEYDNLQDVVRDNIADTVQADDMLQSPRWESYMSTIKSVCELGAPRLYMLKQNDFKSHKVILHNRSIMRDHGQKHGLHDPQILQEIMA
jgi:hypothetical protein